MKTQKGFTLIELLLVLAIIGIISAIAIPALLGQRARARDKATITNMTGTMGDMVSAYDRAKENGGDVTASMAAVVSNANTNGARNPWSPASTAYLASLGTPTALGQVGFVYVAPSAGVAGTLTGHALVQNNVAGSTASGSNYDVTKVSNLE